MTRRQLIKALAFFGVPYAFRAVAAPRPVRIGVDVCPYCFMTVIDGRFVAQVVVETGKYYNYDAIECLADHVNGYAAYGPTVRVRPKEWYLADYARSKAKAPVLIPANQATIVYHKRIRTPMGGGLVAFASREAAEAFVKARRLKGARFLTWAEVLKEGKQHPWVPAF